MYRVQALDFCSVLEFFFPFSFTLTKYLKPRSANLRWRRRLPPQPLRQPKKSLPCQPLPCQPRQSLSPLLPLPHFLMGETRLLSWRITSLIWDPSPALTTGFSTPLEESQVWYSTDELNTPLLRICVHAHFLCSAFLLSIFSHSNTPLLMVSSHVHLNADQRFPFFSSDSWSDMLSSTSCTFSPLCGSQLFAQFLLFYKEICNNTITNRSIESLAVDHFECDVCFHCVSVLNIWI